MSASSLTSVCNRCGQRIVGVKHKYEGKEYCDQCYSALMQELQELEKQKADLYAYIADLFNLTACPDYVIYGVDKALKAGKKVSGIRATIWYYYQINGRIPNNPGEIITVINTEYDNARRYVASVKEVNKKNAEVDLKNIPVNTVKIVSNRKIKKWKPNYRMEDL